MSNGYLKNNCKTLHFNVFNQRVQNPVKFFILGRLQTCQKVLLSCYTEGPWVVPGRASLAGLPQQVCGAENCLSPAVAGAK